MSRSFMAMTQRTKHNLSPWSCISALQKCIRRGMEREAMEFACEMIHTSKAFCTMITHRLEVISHEDIVTAASPWIVPFVAAACEQARRFYNVDNPGKSRMAVGYAIRMMCRAPKSREGDHFQSAIGWPNYYGKSVPTVPDWALDGHTREGKKMGRGRDYFRKESTKLIPPPAQDDAYIEEAYAAWELRDRIKNDPSLL